MFFIKKIIIAFIVNTIISGIIANNIAVFFAAGTIAENNSDKTFVSPEFFLISMIWIVGVLIGAIIYFKYMPKLFLILSIIITWGSIPFGIDYVKNLLT